MQIIGADCSKCGMPFGVERRYPSLYSPAKGVRVYACYGGCGVKAPTVPEAATVWMAEGDEINKRIQDTNWVAPRTDINWGADEFPTADAATWRAEDSGAADVDADEFWGGHFFPEPEEMGCDPEAFLGGPDNRGDCGCGVTYREFQLYGTGCTA